MKIPYYQADAFSSKAFSGNAAGVCLLEEPITDSLMQQIAMENNIAETAFVYRKPGGFRLRWFTPSVELKLCGHGTLATAHILWEQGILKPGETARFFTLSGELTVTNDREWITMSFPAFSFVETDLPVEIEQALGIKVLQAFTASDGRYLVEIDNYPELISMKPDFAVLKFHPTIVVTCRGNSETPYDFFSRSFAPAHGVNEDPVTGSSHCVLTPYWSKKLSKNELFAYQASARGGELKLALQNDRVLITGQVITVKEGSILQKPN